jgi:branched-chain amino acid transport system substrate-binding protein
MRKFFFITFITFLLTGSLFQSCTKTNDTKPAQQTVTVGALLSLTGNWSSLGITSKAAIEIAADDINNYMEGTGSKYRFATTIYDTKLDTAVAKHFITEAKNSGVNFIIGPQSSAEVGALKQFADANNILIVSQGSTAGSLSIANDNIFRFCPDDLIEGNAIANTIYKAGVKGLVTVSRDDAGNKGLQLSTGTAFTNLGGNVGAIASYATTTTDFTSVVAEIKNKIQSFTALYGSAETAVYLASFDESVGLFKQAATDPVLSSVKWYGADGVTLSTALINDAAAANFAAATSFFSPTFGLPTHAQSKWQPLAKAIKDRTGVDPDAFALASYDALWVIALTYNSTAGIEAGFDKLKTVFQQEANIYYGVTGPTLLNDFGDRAIGSFDYWSIVSDNGSYVWKLTGKSE